MGNLPLARHSCVAVLVEAGPGEEEIELRIDVDVVHRPDPRGIVAVDGDLRVVHAVAAVKSVSTHVCAEESDDRVATCVGVLAIAVGSGGVLGEELGELVPSLLVETADVRILERLDGLEVEKVGKCVRRHRSIIDGGVQRDPTRR